jgi:hypothetical protein
VLRDHGIRITCTRTAEYLADDEQDQRKRKGRERHRALWASRGLEDHDRSFDVSLTTAWIAASAEGVNPLTEHPGAKVSNTLPSCAASRKNRTRPLQYFRPAEQAARSSASRDMQLLDPGLDVYAPLGVKPRSPI